MVHGVAARRGAGAISGALAVIGVLAGTNPAAADVPLRVEFLPVVTRETSMQIELTGTLEAVDSVDLGFRQSGRISEMLVSEGDQFTAGQVLGRIDPLQLQQSLNVATATLAAAEAAAQQARQAAERAQAMLDRGVGTRAARDSARQALSEAETQTQQARSALDQARRSVEDTELRAPFDGVVTARSGEPGQVVGAAQAVLSLAAHNGIEAVFMTPDLPILNEVMGISVALSALDVDAPPMTGTVTEISPLVDPSTGSVRVRALVDDAPADVDLLGALVRGKMVLATGEAVEIPWTALTSGGGAPGVWVVDEANRVALRAVDILRFDDGVVLLSGGVAPGEIVVGEGAQKLFPGREVVAGNP
ncbi:efflux RND transporter periplasmic adaptor subunit [uncultured Paracoccus sp.]|uniref:efflux RND transporter periplasmic adaptor subunit n=1 Tax=Paracoccus sp. S1E-3 TaxID=2756130 RepID=UPI0015EECC60|nr:efflux RND transporter periplasmic adaptor subunit [uncultured Paracoccus sp.]MBA4490762.1 efflux RND transporter periplasmic adaptor subunit [Paracoccus sp. S1E-3]